MGIIGAVAWTADLLLEARRGGWRTALRNQLAVIVSCVLASSPMVIADVCIGRVAGLCLMPLGLVGVRVGQTPLGILNFVFLQWFGFRLARSMEWTESDGTQVAVLGEDEHSLGRVADIVAKRGARTRWFLRRWVWPLTGWWSEYRWISNSRGIR